MTPTPLRVRGRPTAVLLVAFLLLIFGASSASAHSGLARSDPPDRGMVAVGRSELTLWFTEAIAAGSSTFDLRTAGGGKVAVKASVSGADGGGFVKIATEPLKKATYVLDWRVLSLGDGHPSNGSVLFGVGVRPVWAASAQNDFPETSGLLLRWLDLSAIILAIGALAVSGRVLGSMGEAAQRPRRRARLTGALAASIAVLTGVIIPFVRTEGGASSPGGGLDALDAYWASLAGTQWGHLWLGRELTLLIAAGAFWWWTARRSESGRAVQVAAGALAATVLLETWAGHASALPARSGLVVLASATHLAAAGVWAGGLTVLAIALIPMIRRDAGNRGPVLAAAWQAFSPVAATATIVLVATGLYESGRHVLDLQSLTSTVYGNAVAGKLALVAVALTLAGINTLLVNPRLAAAAGRVLGRPGGWSPVPLRRFTTMVAAEVLVLVVAAGVAALLTSVPTARETTGAAAQENSVTTAHVDGLFVTFEEAPAAEQSRLIVRARSTVKLEPAPVTGVEIRLVGPTGRTTNVSLAQVEQGRYEAETPKPAPGRWKASIGLERKDRPGAVAQIGWTVAATTPERVRPLEVATTGLAVLLLSGIAGAVAFTRRREEEPADSSSRVRENTVSHA